MAVQLKFSVREDSYLWRTFPDVNKFWAHRESLAFGHWGRTDLQIKPQYLEPQIFDSRVEEGYQATATLNQGYLHDPGSGSRCFSIRNSTCLRLGELRSTPEIHGGNGIFSTHI